MFKRGRMRLYDMQPQIIDELEFGTNVHALIDNLLQAAARNLPQIHLAKRVGKKLDKSIIHNQIDLDPGYVGANDLQRLTRDLGILAAMLLEQHEPRLDQIVDAMRPNRVFIERDYVRLLGSSGKLTVHNLAVNRQQHLQVKVGIACAPRTGGHEIVEERRPPVWKIDERDEGKQLSRLACYKVFLVRLAVHLHLQPRGHELFQDGLLTLLSFGITGLQIGFDDLHAKKFCLIVSNWQKFLIFKIFFFN